MSGDIAPFLEIHFGDLQLFCLQPNLLFLVSELELRIMTQVAAGVAKWQTRQTQNLLYASMCGFKSLHRHSSFTSEEVSWIFF